MPESPELKARLKKLKQIGPYTNPLIWHGLQKEAEQIAEHGHVDVNFLFGPEHTLPPGQYRIEFTPEEAEQWFDAAELFVYPFSPFETFAEALGPDLEALTCGSRPERYQRVAEQEKPTGFLRHLFRRSG
jgi:hypothetical protein